jgi:hypothetical protein
MAVMPVAVMMMVVVPVMAVSGFGTAGRQRANGQRRHH